MGRPRRSIRTGTASQGLWHQAEQRAERRCPAGLELAPLATVWASTLLIEIGGNLSFNDDALQIMQQWATFLHNHARDIWACDFVAVTDLFFRPIYAFVLIALATRRVVHVGVTRHPTDAWGAQQLHAAITGLASSATTA